MNESSLGAADDGGTCVLSPESSWVSYSATITNFPLSRWIADTDRLYLPNSTVCRPKSPRRVFPRLPCSTRKGETSFHRLLPTPSRQVGLFALMQQHHGSAVK